MPIPEYLQDAPPEIAEQAVAVGQLAQEAVSPEDQKTIEEWQREVERKEALALIGSNMLPKLVQRPDGSIVPEEAHRAALEDGQEHPGAYTRGQR